MLSVCGVMLPLTLVLIVQPLLADHNGNHTWTGNAGDGRFGRPGNRNPVGGPEAGDTAVSLCSLTASTARSVIVGSEVDGYRFEPLQAPALLFDQRLAS